MRMPVRFRDRVGDRIAVWVRLSLASLVFLSTIAGQIAAAQVAGEDPSHQELRALRDDLVDAVSKQDMPRLLSHLHPNVVVTWQNAEVSRGHDGVRAYLTRMMSGDQRIVDRFTTKVDVDELTILYGGDTGIAFGRSQDQFELHNGPTFELASRWTATLVKEGGAWKIAAFHASTNLFDNPVLRMLRQSIVWTTVTAGVAGLAIGVAIMWFVGRRRRMA
jgi:ketosteroid isomerase-like protein